MNGVASAGGRASRAAPLTSTGGASNAAMRPPHAREHQRAESSSALPAAAAVQQCRDKRQERQERRQERELQTRRLIKK